MKKSQKEGVVIISMAIIIALICCLASNWRTTIYAASYYTNILDSGSYTIPFEEASIGFSSISFEIGERTYSPLLFRLMYVLTFLLVIFIYGLLRSFNIIKRLFRFEVWLGKLVMGDRDDEKN